MTSREKEDIAMNRQLAEAIIVSFQEAPAKAHYVRLNVFDERAWLKTYKWLDASGLALYFLARLNTLHITNAVPVAVLHRLEKNAADNQNRMQDMFAEFIQVNSAFLKAGLSYVNVKGFTLVPDACPDASLRCQFDLDFKMARSDMQKCDEILKELGYRSTGADGDVREFKAGPSQITSLRNLYKIIPQRSLEIAFTAKSAWNEISNSELRSWDGVMFPVFSECDKFIGLSVHLFKHLQSEWTRVSWILEYSAYINFHRMDKPLWKDIHQELLKDAHAKISVGAATLLAKQIFPTISLPSILVWAVEELDNPTRLWIEYYGYIVALSEFPGSKLYLLLQKALEQDSSHKRRSKRIFPFRFHRRIARPATAETSLKKISNIITELNYGAFRMSFHIVGSFYYLIEIPRWKKIIVNHHN
jgi:hypothetical protein